MALSKNETITHSERLLADLRNQPMTPEELNDRLGIARRQSFPASIAADLRDYAAKLGLPPDWFKRLTHTERPDAATGGAMWIFAYEGKPFANYATDILKEIGAKLYHLPIPPPPDPLVVASECAVSQPADKQWRRFKHLVFQRSQIAYVNEIGKAGRETGESFEIVFVNGNTLVCGNEKNYANTGLSTCEFFIRHVLELAPERHA